MINRSELVQQVLDGYESPLQALAILKEEKEHVEKCIKEIEDVALDEAQKQGAKSFQYKNWSFELRNGRRIFDFKHIPEWVERQQSLKEVEERAKHAFMAKTQSNVIAVTADGEVIDLPKVSYTKDVLVIKKL
jgi:hypothetical protein